MSAKRGCGLHTFTRCRVQGLVIQFLVHLLQVLTPIPRWEAGAEGVRDIPRSSHGPQLRAWHGLGLAHLWPLLSVTPHPALALPPGVVSGPEQRLGSPLGQELGQISLLQSRKSLLSPSGPNILYPRQKC